MEKISAETLRRIRDQKGMTQGQFADFLGVSLRSYQNYEKGETIPDTKQELFQFKLRAENAVNEETTEYKKAPPEEVRLEDLIAERLLDRLKPFLSHLTEEIVKNQGLMDIEMTRIREYLEEIHRVQEETQKSVKVLEQKM